MKVFYHGANLRNANEIRDLASFALQKFDNKVDILVNNAGIQHVAPVDQFPGPYSPVHIGYVSA